LTDWEHIWAYAAGGGLTLIILAFGIAATRSGSNEGLILVLVTGTLFLIGGTAGWLIQVQPWKNFDDLTTPYYTGHAHHDDHAASDDHADHEIQAAIAEMSDANITVGEPYAHDFGGGHIEHVDVAPIVAAQVDLPPPPVILDPMSAFPEPTPEPAAPLAKPASPAKSMPDDLTQLKGIGPKINGVLKAAGITTFAQLAEQSVADLEHLVRAGEVKSVIHPENWVADAKKVVAGDRSVLEHPDRDTKS